MMSYYGTEHEASISMKPRDVLEIVSVDDWDGKTRLKNYENCFIFTTLCQKKYQCSAESLEEKNRWIEAINHALNEPNRIVDEEIQEEKNQMKEDKEREDMVNAQAEKYVQKVKTHEAQLEQIKEQLDEANSEYILAGTTAQNALEKFQQSQTSLKKVEANLRSSKEHAHDMTIAVMKSPGDRKEQAELSAHQASEEAAHLNAQYELEYSKSESLRKDVEDFREKILTKKQEIQSLNQKLLNLEDNRLEIRKEASIRVQKLRAAKQLSFIHAEKRRKSISHLDSLAEGYLMYKKSGSSFKMHRKYFVLFGKTLTLYNNLEHFQKMGSFDNNPTSPNSKKHLAEISPCNVYHVKGALLYSGKPIKSCPNAFEILTLEGKKLLCSAPVQHEIQVWISAIQMGMTMAPMSPQHAMRAKSRRKLFEFTLDDEDSKESTTTSNVVEASNISDIAQQPESVQETSIHWEGYLVKKAHYMPLMQKRYCVLDGVFFKVFQNHDDYEKHKQDCLVNADIESNHHEIENVCEWNGKTTVFHYSNGFQIDTSEHEHFLCHASSPEEKSKWISKIHSALVRHVSEAKFAESGRTSKNVSPDVAKLALEDALKIFEKWLRQYFNDHVSGKEDDVLIFLKLYKGKERNLVEHLDKKYQTSLITKEGMADILEKLKFYSALSISTVSEHNEIAQKMQGFVTLKDMKSNGKERKMYCVLEGYNEIKWFEDHSQFILENENILFQHTIFNIFQDDDQKSDKTFSIVVSTAHEPHASFASSFRSFLHGNTSEKSLICSVDTEDDMVKWVSAIRANLGWIRAHGGISPNSAATTTSHFWSKKQQHEVEIQNLENTLSVPEDKKMSLLTEKLKEFYGHHNPSKVTDVETLLHYYKGNELELLEKLDKIYSTLIAKDKEYLSLIPKRLCNDTCAELSQYIIEGYLKKKDSRNHFSKLTRTYCVLNESTFSCFNAYEDSRNVNKVPLFCEVITSVSDWELPKKNQSLVDPTSEETSDFNFFGFRLKTENDITVFCEAENLKEKQKWMKKVRLALKTEKNIALAKQPDQFENEFERRLFEKLVEFYEAHNSAEKNSVSSILTAFKGKELKMLEEIDRIYHTHLAKDDSFLDLIKKLPKAGDTSQEYKEENISSIEGYLFKKGHLNPSMKKRYCILNDDTLRYYETHEDAKTVECNPLGSLEITSVSEWEGKTRSKEFPFGFEIGTANKHVYFCAAYNKADQLHWIAAIRRGISKKHVESNDISNDNPKEKMRLENLKNKLLEFYMTHNPSKQSDVPALLLYYRNRETSLLEALDETYGTSLMEDKSFTMLAAVDKDKEAENQSQTSIRMEGYLKKHVHGSVRSMQQFYFILEHATLSQYPTREGQKSGQSAAKTYHCGLVSDWDGSHGFHVANLCASFGFTVTCSSNTVIKLSAENELDKKKWMESIQAAIDLELGESIIKDEKQELNEAMEQEKHPKNEVKFNAEGYLTYQDSKMHTMAEYYFTIYNQYLVVFANHQDSLEDIVYAKYCVIGIDRGWDGKSFLHSCSNPFRIITTENGYLYCNAATERDLLYWLKNITTLIEQNYAKQLLEDQKMDVDAQIESKSAVVTNGEIAIKEVIIEHKKNCGYLKWKTDRSGNMTEGYFEFNENYEICIYSDYNAFEYAKDEPIFQALALNILEWGDGERQSSRQFGFNISVDHEQFPCIYCHASSKFEQEKWISLILTGINKKRGEEVLNDELNMMKVEENEANNPAAINEIDSNLQNYRQNLKLVVENSSMEGCLRRKMGMLTGYKENYYAIVGRNLRLYTDLADAQSGNDIQEVQICSVLDWEAAEKNTFGLQIGIKLKEDSNEEFWKFALSLSEEREAWTIALQECLKISLADSFLDEESQILSNAIEDGLSSLNDQDNRLYEGYIKIKHGHLALLKERYCILKGAWLSLYEKHEDVDSSDLLEKVELVGISEWHGDILNSTNKDFHGFLLETNDHGCLECRVATLDEKNRWLQAIHSGLYTLREDEVVQRNNLLSKIEGASMEGYLKKKGAQFRDVKNRYCVLIGLQWIYYENQKEAIQASSIPLGALEVTKVGDWNIHGEDRILQLQDKNVTQHAFQITTSKNEVIHCIAHSGVEKSSWMEAITRELSKASDEEKKIENMMKAAHEKDEKLKQIKTKHSLYRMEADKSAKAFKAYTDDDWDDDDDDEEAFPVDYLDMGPENSPLRKARTRLCEIDKPPTTTENVKSSSSWGWIFCTCFSRPQKMKSALVEPLLSEGDQEYYKVEFYDSGYSDLE